jgi:phospholipid/cholesterol/gamma-HCH transport system permease protein
MQTQPAANAAITLSPDQSLTLSGSWTARGMPGLDQKIADLSLPPGSMAQVNGAGIDAFDSAGAWVLQKLLLRTSGTQMAAPVTGLQPDFSRLLQAVQGQLSAAAVAVAPARHKPSSPVQNLGRATLERLTQPLALLGFVGESAVALAGCVRHPRRIRWRPILFNLRSAGFDALPIVGLLSLLLGVVVAYQGANQLRQYGANIFVADLIGLSMLREFAPLITAIIIAGRSGSAYAAQIGTMMVTEEIDAMRTVGIVPQELLVLPKVVALVIAMPLLTVFADVLGVLGGMMMARLQLGVGYGEFMDRLVKAVSVTDYLIGVLKAPVFAAIIVMVGCFQGFRTQGGADSVGRQTTRSVVQSIFLVIVADALFSVAFSALDL